MYVPPSGPGGVVGPGVDEEGAAVESSADTAALIGYENISSNTKLMHSTVLMNFPLVFTITIPTSPL